MSQSHDQYTCHVKPSQKKENQMDNQVALTTDYRLDNLPPYNPDDLDSVYNRAQAYASAVLSIELKEFENWIVRDEWYSSSPDYAIGPLEKPPVRNGMTDCFKKLDAILVPNDRRTIPSPAQLRQVRPWWLN